MSDEHPVSVEWRDILSPVARTRITARSVERSVRCSEPGANHVRLDADEVAPGDEPAGRP